MGFSYWHWRYIQTHGYFPKIPRERFRLRRVTAISFVCIRCNGQLLKRSARSNRFSKSYFWNSKVVVFPPPLCYVMGGQHAGVDLDTRVHLKNTHEEITASTLLNSLTFLFFPPPSATFTRSRLRSAAGKSGRAAGLWWCSCSQLLAPGLSSHQAVPSIAPTHTHLSPVSRISLPGPFFQPGSTPSHFFLWQPFFLSDALLSRTHTPQFSRPT